LARFAVFFKPNAVIQVRFCIIRVSQDELHASPREVGLLHALARFEVALERLIERCEGRRGILFALVG
jgi:hypothetical protein